MPNPDFGNIGDVFKHVALAEILATFRPKEYWESHAGSAFHDETPGVSASPAREHGVGHFVKSLGDFDALRRNIYTRAILEPSKDGRARRIPGSPYLALAQLGDTVRRYLFCDLDAGGLGTIRGLARDLRVPESKIECVPDDGIMLLRGAGLTLSEQWTQSTLAFIDPATLQGDEGDVSPVDLWCELGNRGIGAVLCFKFGHEDERKQLHSRFIQSLDKARLLTRKSNGFEGSFKLGPSEGLKSPWGFGLLTINIGDEATAVVDRSLRALEAAYAVASLDGGGAGSGAWRYSCRTQ